CVSRARYVVALTGAGLSVESGIPPFRGPGGLWTKHGEPPLDGYQRFLRDPRAAWEERLNPSGPMRELWQALTEARPNPGHLALVELEDMGVLKATITRTSTTCTGARGAAACSRSTATRCSCAASSVSPVSGATRSTS